MNNFLTCAAVLLIVSGLAQGAILDQAQEFVNGITTVGYYGSSYVQTFTAGISGQLDYIDLHAVGPSGGTGDPGYPTTVGIVNVVGGKPAGPVVAQVDSYRFKNGWNSISFLSQSVYLTAGTQYGIMLDNDDMDLGDEPTLGLSFGCSQVTQVYAGGLLWKGYPGLWEDNWWTRPWTDVDACFRTYIVPEPTTLLLLGLGGLALTRRRK